ncbi:MAG: DUF177 domain-containing protein [Candidatus Marinimicrobia bacterium]|jgi:uncharacterized protein|nr:DUF177 domain-containing protein [Candidatus Neomarinimicrobiota bacterium]MDD4961755.1 DUF177 domain-containing protein [Candidatus Neomarinimicrobiota bacterium]MDD5709002.1 DUF177 domain-containing protein [Candidatus Neomarinimicrobiota bacterium]MDX9777668.1 DUF177 domain-containing protein [bacterium]
MKILISHISDDTRLFDFTAKRTHFDIPELHQDVQLHAEVYRSGSNFYVSATVKTVLELECDRCLDPYRMPVEETFRVIFARNIEDEKEDDVAVLEPGAVELDLRPFVRDILMLIIPFKKLCSENCRGLCVLCGANLNRETCSCDRNRIDPRWDKLNELKKTLENAEE